MARAKKAPPRAYEEFVFHIRSPSLSYGFGIEHDRRRRQDEPFSRRHSVEFITECLYPDRFKGREGKATIYPDEALVDHKLLAPEDVRRRWVGYVRATKGEFETVLYLPPEDCWHIGAAMASGMVRSFLTNGLVETRGMNRITSSSFYGPDFDPVEYVG
jgi:hypothetical protein